MCFSYLSAAECDRWQRFASGHDRSLLPIQKILSHSSGNIDEEQSDYQVLCMTVIYLSLLTPYNLIAFCCIKNGETNVCYSSKNVVRNPKPLGIRTSRQRELNIQHQEVSFPSLSAHQLYFFLVFVHKCVILLLRENLDILCNTFYSPRSGVKERRTFSLTKI